MWERWRTDFLEYLWVERYFVMGLWCIMGDVRLVARKRVGYLAVMDGLRAEIAVRDTRLQTGVGGSLAGLACERLNAEGCCEGSSSRSQVIQPPPILITMGMYDDKNTAMALVARGRDGLWGMTWGWWGAAAMT